jgi:multidrug efflux pump subunit AcrB
METLFFRNRNLMTLFIAVLLVGGASALFTLPRMEDPELNNRNGIIVTLFPGASAERVEALVTEKIEEEVREVSEIDFVESTSRPGVSLISIELQDRIVATDEIWSKVRDKIAAAESQLPPGALKPYFDDTRGAEAFGVIVALRWNLDRPVERGVLTRLGEELGDRLRNLPGTELVRVYGGSDEEITVTVEPESLADLGLSVADVSRRLASADAKSAAGALRGEGASVYMEVTGELDSLDRIARVPLVEGENGEMLRLGAVARVERGWADPPRELALHNGAPAVLVAARVEDQKRIDLWAAGAHELIDELESSLSGGVEVVRVFDQSSYTMRRLGGLAANLLAGGLIVVAVILVMMGWRSALLVGSALPLTVAGVLLGLSVLGVPLHQMSVTGLIIALGLLIDNAIVVADEVKNRMKSAGAIEAIRQSVSHLFVPLLSSTLTTVLAFLPILLLAGSVGEFVGTIALSVIVALATSFVVSLTVVSTLTGIIEARTAGAGEAAWWQAGLRLRRVGGWYESTLRKMLRRPLLGVAATVALPLVGFIVAPTLKQLFFPSADRDQFHVQVWMPSETSIERTQAYARQVEAVLRSEPSVEDVTWVAGRSAPSFYYNMLMNQDDTPGYAQALVKARSYKDVVQAVPRLQRQVNQALPEAQVVLRLLGQGPPIDAPVEIRVFGPSLDGLREAGEELRLQLAAIPEVVHTQASLARREPKLWIDADEDQAKLAGLSLIDVAGQIEQKLEGGFGGSLLDETEELPVRIRFANEKRRDLDAIRSINLATPATRDWVPVRALGDFELAPEYSGIPHRSGERMNVVKAHLTADALPPEVTAELLERLERSGFALPAGYRFEVGGDSEERQEATANLMAHAPVLLVLMVAVLVLSFGSFALAGQIGLVAVLSVGLGLFAIWTTGYPYGFMAMIGTAGLIGVAINGSIIVLAAIRADADASAGDPDAIADQVIHNTRHVLATTLTTAGGFLPLVLAGGGYWPPLAVVIAGGVVGSTPLALAFTPALYAWTQRRTQQQTAKQIVSFETANEEVVA